MYLFLLKSKKITSVLLLTIALYNISKGQDTSKHLLDIGIRVQKTYRFYYENGLSAHYSHDALLNKRIILGLSYITSRLGSAIASNALKQDNYIFSTTYLFLEKSIVKPLTRANIGYFYVDYESPIFDVLPNTTVTLAFETGMKVEWKLPLKLELCIGYNFITGDGKNFPGTLYPLYFQTTLLWDIFKKM